MDQKALEQAMIKILDKKLDPIAKKLDKLQSKFDKIDKLEEDFFSKQYDDFIVKIKGLEDVNASLVDRALTSNFTHFLKPQVKFP